MAGAGTPPSLRANARRLRQDMTDAERKLWNVLRAHRLGGIGFRRQMPVGRYIVDFAAPTHRLVIELDGSQHAEEANAARDGVRDAWFEAAGWRVIRFWNGEVMNNLDGVCETIWIEAKRGGGDG
ncbi:endonuclease domain-containing protein [Breoghania sp. L-A4]|uniref:endonuclease domain-containing protein n=1 Tax=Breoghania sp. L-A4 TaxID=2304600 RepID=UPI0020BF1676|nr:endonuclease domain-containing protein [Breoghania sp. L-A4]